MSERYWLSFHGSAHCRRARGESIDEAVRDSLDAAHGAGMTCTLLDKNLNRVGHTERNDSISIFWHEDGRREILKETA